MDEHVRVARRKQKQTRDIQVIVVLFMQRVGEPEKSIQTQPNTRQRMVVQNKVVITKSITVQKGLGSIGVSERVSITISQFIWLTINRQQNK